MEENVHSEYPNILKEKLNALGLLDAIQLNLRMMDDDGHRNNKQLPFKIIFETIRYESVYLTAVEIKKFLVTIQQIEKQKNFDVPFLNELFMSYRCILQQFGLSLSQQDLFLEDKKQSISHHKEGVVV
jgi:hypothetical protein